LRESARVLATRPIDLLCPAHGDVIPDPERALRLLDEHLGAVIAPFDPDLDEPLNFPEVDSPAPGFRQITPHIHQWRTGNTIVLTSDDGFALVVDDGLCIWEPLEQRTVKHDAIFREMKAKLGIKAIEWVVPTHYHGDHTDYVSHLAKNEGARVIALDSIAGPMEFPERYNLAAPLPWYDSFSKVVNIDVRVPEGFVLHWRNHALTFFHLGGQTFHHLGIEAVVDGLKVLFVGDSWWGTRSSNPILCWNDAEPRTRGWVYGLDRMIERNPDLLVCGHGSVLRDPLPYLRKARAEWDKRLDAYAVLNPRPTDDLFFNPFFS